MTAGQKKIVGHIHWYTQPPDVLRELRFIVFAILARARNYCSRRSLPLVPCTRTHDGLPTGS
jgi:hypothetical protein